MRVLVTRPAAQAAEWVDRLRAEAIDAVALPLIGIAPALDPQPLHAAWRTLAQRRLVMFVSANAALQFFAARPAGCDWPATTWAASPGPGTTQALRALGVPEAQIVAPAVDAPQFDSEALWLRLEAQDWQAASLLFVRGETGRDWLADRLRERGAQVEHVVAYRRGPPQWSAAERDVAAAALAEPARHLWWFSSSEAIDHLAAATSTTWHDAHALATHPRIAARARHLGFQDVVEVRASTADVLAAIQRSIQSFAP